MAGGPINQQVVFLDLDSTLAHTLHRRHLINWDDVPSTDWDAYAAACEDDDVFQAVRKLVYDLACLYKVVIVSGRSGSALEQTKRWLRKHQVPYDDLILRPRDDPSSDNHVLKIEQIQKWLDAHPGMRVRFLIDDWPPVVEAAEAMGWDVLLVNPNYPKREEREQQDGLTVGTA